MRATKAMLLWTATLLAAPVARAAVTLPYLIADRMVVQRGLPVHIWGMAEPGETVTVTFRGSEQRSTADAVGRWSVHLPPGEAGGPFEMTIRGADMRTLRDVLVGDVWVASGQSNMEWPMNRSAGAAREMPAARHPRIRLVRAMHKTSEYPVDDLVGDMWRECTPETAADFSAVAYHFGRAIQQSSGAPIGLIQTAWGGTPLDGWTSLRAISADPALMPVFAEWDARMQEYALARLRYHRAAKEWEAATAADRAQRKKVAPPPAKPTGPDGPWEPGVLYNAMVAPITPFAIRGVIWYQGEANGSNRRAPLYGRLFRAMIQDWRRAWGIGDFPFLFVQLANYNAPDSDWPELREGQRQALALRNTAMAVTIDAGTPEDIHPPDKQTVGTRLSLAARALVYGEAIEYSGPLPRQAAAQGGSVTVWFDHAEGLSVRGGGLRGFEVAGENRQFVPADARIEGGAVVLHGHGIVLPRWVRHAWKDNPDCCLYNAAGLPAPPFRLEIGR
ncbi:MAG: Sialic acid-specific 9-O-acetylesterase [Thermomicrobiales bacterium]|nr:Sialic acid-specific 9-O-acetylesterase [Thermomicrobiales bacterium]